LFPYTTLFRSGAGVDRRVIDGTSRGSDLRDTRLLEQDALVHLARPEQMRLRIEAQHPARAVRSADPQRTLVIARRQGAPETQGRAGVVLQRQEQGGIVVQQRLARRRPDVGAALRRAGLVALVAVVAEGAGEVDDRRLVVRGDD